MSGYWLMNTTTQSGNSNGHIELQRCAHGQPYGQSEVGHEYRDLWRNNRAGYSGWHILGNDPIGGAPEHVGTRPQKGKGKWGVKGGEGGNGSDYGEGGGEKGERERGRWIGEGEGRRGRH